MLVRQVCALENCDYEMTYLKVICSVNSYIDF